MKGVEVFQNLDSCLAIILITATATVPNTIAHIRTPNILARITLPRAPRCHWHRATMQLILGVPFDRGVCEPHRVALPRPQLSFCPILFTCHICESATSVHHCSFAEEG